MNIATAKQLKQYDQALLDYGYTIEELVDKASDALLPYFLEYQVPIIMCGPGNNGADGISLGIKLYNRGKKVKLVLTGKPEKLSKANAYYLKEANEIEMIQLDENNLDKLNHYLNEGDVIVDALFGFGLNSDLRGIAKTLVDQINQEFDGDVIAIDIPTGLNPDTGKSYNTCIWATKTISLTALKQGFLNEDSKMFTGDVYVETLDVVSKEDEVGLAKIIDEKWARYHLKPRLFNGHKGTYGRVLHMTGCSHYRGAAMLAGRASLMCGSGIVTVYSDLSVIDSLASFAPECTSVVRQDYFDRHVLDDKNAVMVGSGLGLNEVSEQLFLSLMDASSLPMVIDGDALTLLGKHPEFLKGEHASYILTPHLGEFARLTTIYDDVALVEQAKQYAQEKQVILVLKGPNTIVTDGKVVYRNASGNKAMASPGMGDALAGIIVSLLGQGYSPLVSAALGVYIHGLCGDEVAKNQYTVLSSQVIEQIPYIMKRILQD